MSQPPLPLPDTALSHLSAVICEKKESPDYIDVNKSSLVRACQRIFSAMKMTVILNSDEKLSLSGIAKIANCQYRKVTLSGQWWNQDNGALLGFHHQTGQPCALLPRKSGGYELFDPITAKTVILTKKVATLLARQAVLFYRPFKKEPIKLRYLIGFALKPQIRDIVRVLSSQLLLGIFALFIPIATGYLFETVVPNSDIDLLSQFIIGLTVSVFSMMAFNIIQMISLIRIKFKMTLSVQSAVWNRLLNLPVNFFRKFYAGDLADRAGGIDAIQERMTGVVLQGLLTGVFSLLTLALMLYYSRWLTLIAIGLLSVTAFVIVIFNIIQLGYQRRHYAVNGKLQGFMLQLLTAISKLRVANKEANAYEQWAIQFSKKTRILFKSGTLHYYLDIFQVFFTIINLIVLFHVVVAEGEKLSFGQFIAFNAAYGQFIASFFALTGILTQILGIIPLYERVKPILLAEHESNDSSKIAISIQGGVEVSDLCFSYSQADDAPLVLKNISMKIKPQQFIAIVGLSGSGKSTLLRLLMGFEKPISGCICYDGYDLSDLNVASLREKMGIVLQSQPLLPGTILENLIGTAELSEEKAWQLARITAIDADIAAMSMKMHTMMVQSGQSLSMGQRQRIALARALAHQPRLLLLDEATSAIDNTTQQLIYDNLAKLSMTKVITAHRLSTIANADMIYVFEKGEIVQQGNYNDLISQPGLFIQLVKRQML